MKKLLVLILFVFSLHVFAQSRPIADLRVNDSNGIPVLMDSIVTITGVMTSSTQFGTSGPGSIQDSSGAVSVYGQRIVLLQQGDSVSIIAPVTHYNGLTEIDLAASSAQFSKFGKGTEVIPLDVTIGDITGQEWNGFERYESMLVKLKGIKFSSSGSFEGNTNYNISDSTGTMQLRIDNSVSSVIGNSIPQSEIDVVGIVGQYKSSSPYNSGYQILPRSIDDFQISNEPLIVNPVVATAVTMNSFTVYFNTINEGDTRVKFGETTDLELGEFYSAEPVRSHSALIERLDQETKYYYQVESSNDFGTSISEIFSVTTRGDDTASYGTFNVYFNGSVDNNVAIPGNEAVGNVKFDELVIDRINSATYSLDIALYSFTLSDVANAIIGAKNRGVKVRVVYDARNTQDAMQALINAGIKISQRPEGLSGIMHNKFMIVDARDNNFDNDWVWMGSWNWTTQELSWKNNVIEINNSDLATEYTKEFEEMWGSSTDEPNSSAARFGENKTDNTEHTFNINGIPVNLYFSPSDGTESKISNAFVSADSSMYFAVLSYTSDPISAVMQNKFNSGVTDLRGIINNTGDQGTEFNVLNALNPDDISAYSFSGTLHHKYGLVDAPFASSNPTTITGSHNWSKSAETRNDENTLIIEDIYIANKYMQEFKKRYNEVGGTTDFVVPVITSVKNEKLYPSEIELNQNYPNPFNPLTTISFFIPQRQFVNLSVYNTLGEKITELVNEVRESGLNVVDFNMQNSGVELSSGVYLYSLITSSGVISKKMILLK